MHSARGEAGFADVRGDMEATTVGTLKILEKRNRVDWDYDEEGDVLYLSIGRPRTATGVDIGQGAVVRYEERKRVVVGLSILGVRARLIKSLGKS